MAGLDEPIGGGPDDSLLNAEGARNGEMSVYVSTQTSATV